MPIGIIDILIGVILAYGVFKGFKRGLLLGLISFFSFFIAIIAAVHFSGTISAFYIEKYPEYETFIPLVVFILFFLAVVVILSILGRILKRIIDLTLLGGLDNIAGGVFGLLLWAFFISTAMYLFSFVGLHVAEDYRENSILLPYMEPIAPMVFDFVAGVVPGLENWMQPFKDFDFLERKYFTINNQN